VGNRPLTGFGDFVFGNEFEHIAKARYSLSRPATPTCSKSIDGGWLSSVGDIRQLCTEGHTGDENVRQCSWCACLGTSDEGKIEPAGCETWLRDEPAPYFSRIALTEERGMRRRE
jgi:hypothetical protein